VRKKDEPEIANAKPKPDQGWQSLTSTNAWGQARELLSNGLTMQQARAAAGPWRAGGAPPRCKAERLPRRACLSRRMLFALLASRAAGAAASCVSCSACRRSPALARDGLLTLAICGIRSCHIRSVGGTRTECAPRLAVPASLTSLSRLTRYAAGAATAGLSIGIQAADAPAPDC